MRHVSRAQTGIRPPASAARRTRRALARPLALCVVATLTRIALAVPLLVSQPAQASPAPQTARAAQAAPAADATVTYTRDIAPLVDRHCISCHRPDGPAPFSLLTYDDVRRRAALIRTVTANRYMPPWKPAPGMGDFIGERRLTERELDTIAGWIAAGTPEGNPADRPPAPRFTAGWQLGTPDLIVSLPAYTLRAEGLDVFRNFVVPIPPSTNGGTRNVRGVEFRPGSSAVHHANIRLDSTRASRQLDDADDGPGYEGLILHSADYPDGHFLGWTPGQFAPLAPPGLAWRLSANADFVVQLHMRPSGKPETIAPQIGLYFTDDPPTQHPVMLRLGRQNLDIAPGDAHYVSRDSYVLPVDAQVIAVQPHSHYRAREVRAMAEPPGGRAQPIIGITRWDFAWQDVYRLAHPTWVAAGTRLTSEYIFDNSAGNPRNPEQPPARAVWGFKSSDEMADVWIQVLTRSEADRDRLLTDFGRKMIAEDLVGTELQLALAPANVPLRNDAALLHLQLGQVAEAVGHFAVVAQQQPDSAVAHYNLGTALEQAGTVADASTHYERAVALDPRYAAARVNLGAMRLRQGRLDDAVREFDAAVTLAPDDAGARNNLGRVLLNAGRPAAAAPHLEAAVRLSPQNPDAQFNLAELYVTTGRLREAVLHHREALRLRPNWEPALIGLSWLLSASADSAIRNPVDAMHLATAAVDASRRGNPLALDALAAAYARVGRFSEAMAAADDAITLARQARADDLASQIARRRSLYEAGRPYTAAAP